MRQERRVLILDGWLKWYVHRFVEQSNAKGPGDPGPFLLGEGFSLRPALGGVFPADGAGGRGGCLSDGRRGNANRLLRDGSGQGRLVYANNGEHSQEAQKRFDAPSGVLAEWDGTTWAEQTPAISPPARAT